MGLKKVIHTYSKREVSDMIKKYKQLENLSMLGINDPDALSIYEKWKELQVVNLKKEKICDNIRGKTWSYGML